MMMQDIRYYKPISSFVFMKIYFAGSIRGGRDDADLYSQMINYLQQYGEVLTEHVGDKKLALSGEDGKSDDYLDWVLQSDVIIAEVTTPSLGVGYEIGRGVENKKRILCLHRAEEGKRLSAMIAGCPNVTNRQYKGLNEQSRQ